jgi:hypothetical protein
MKFMTTWSVRPESQQEAIRRFLAGEAAPIAGVTLLGRWHSVDLSVGYTLSESEDAAAVYRNAARWSDVMDLDTQVVIEDADAGPTLAGIYKP